MRFLIMIFVIIGSSGSVFCQQKANVLGVLTDSTRSERISYATVTVYAEGDSTLVAYRLSDEKGAFRLTSIPLGNYRLVITAWQYQTKTINIEITGNDVSKDLGEIKISKSTNQLTQIEIIGKRPPIIVRNDTIEFNAESFKTLPTAVVEDLLKKLPGMQIDAGGKITFNGRAVNRILVDGKEFFEGDVQIASKNLPSNIVDKVQVMEDEEIKRMNPNLAKMDIPQVINLTLKKSVKRGMFGKMYAGKGYGDDYEAGGMLNIFRDTTQVSVIGFSNNVNKTGFNLSDLQRIGGFSRSGYGRISNSEDGYAIDNVSFGGVGNGLQQSSMIGLNFNTIAKKNIKINGKYFYGYSDWDIYQLVDENQLVESDRLITSSISNSNSLVNSHNLSAKIVGNPTKKTQFTITPLLSFGPQNNKRFVQKNTTNGSGAAVNNSASNTDRASDVFNYSITSYLYHDFKKPKRRISSGLTVRRDHNKEENLNLTDIVLSNISNTVDQLRDNTVSIFEMNSNTTFSEPISKKINFSASLVMSYFDNQNKLGTFFRNASTNRYDINVPSLTDQVRQSGFKTNSSARLIWNVNSKLSIQPALLFGTININNRFLKFTDFKRNYYFVNPGLNIRMGAFMLDYSRSFLEPSLQYIQPIANNTDISFVQRGNPSLIPSKTHRVMANFGKFNVKSGLNFNSNIIGQLQDDGIILSRTVDAQGVQTTLPINTSETFNISHGSNISKQFNSKKRQLTINAGYFFSIFQNPLILNQREIITTRNFISPTVGFRLNFADKVELFENYYANISTARSKDNVFNSQRAIQQSSETEVVLRLIKNVVLESTFKFQGTDQKIGNYQNQVKIWNSAATFLFLKNNKGMLKFSINDILNEGLKRTASVSDNIIRNVQTNNIGRYTLLSFTYNIQNFNQKVGGKERFLSF